MDPLTIGLELAAVFVAITAAVVYLRSALVKQRSAELVELADTRGDRILDLEKRVQDLRSEMDKMAGELEFLRRLKTEEIAAATADEVVVRLLPFLQET